MEKCKICNERERVYFSGHCTICYDKEQSSRFEKRNRWISLLEEIVMEEFCPIRVECSDNDWKNGLNNLLKR